MQNTLILAAALATLAAAQGECPNGGGSSTVNGVSVCCPGITQEGSYGLECLIGCNLVKPDCFPFCSVDNNLYTTGICTTVPVTASDYSELVYGGGSTATAVAGGSNGGSSGGSSGGDGSDADVTSAAPATVSAVLTGSPSATASGFKSVATASGSTSAKSSSNKGSASASSASATSTSSHAGAPAVTAAPVLLLGALAGMAML